MKTILLGLFSIVMFVSYGQEQENKTVTATFNGYEDGVYYFSDGEDESYEFEEVDTEVLKAFNLKNEKFIDQKFKVTYREEKYEDEDGFEHETWVIVELELIEE